MNLNFRWAAALVDQLRRTGAELAVVAPGSRSAPLAWACAEGLRTHVVLDERSAAFVALGMAKGTGRPAVVVATSGTAGSHFYPAILEAEAAGVPLVALTADRPPELHGCGAPQTIDQQFLFGNHARFADLGLPAPDFRPLRALLAATIRRDGPTHLNAPFREPLSPVQEPLPELTDAPADVATPAAPLPDVRAALEALKPRGVILCGPRDAEDELPRAVEALARTTGYAVIAEAASQLRFTVPSAVAHADTILRNDSWARALRPDVVVRFGGGVTSKVVQEYADLATTTIVVHERGEVVDPSRRASFVLHGEAPAIARALAAGGQGGPLAALFRVADQRVRAALEDLPFGEPLVARETLASVPAHGQLFVSSSMPIRDLDAFGTAARPGVRILANRGVNGIDGIVSTAAGAALATGRPTTALVGDLAFQHDLGGLLAASRLGARLRIVVVHNDGGGIFHFLPIARHAERFETLFGTPHGLAFAHAAALAGFPFQAARDAAGLREALKASGVVEVRTDRTANVEQHRALHDAAARALGDPP